MNNVIAFHSGALGHYSVTEAIRRIGRAGYGGVELNAENLPWAKPHVTPDLSQSDRRAIRRAAAEAGIAISSIAPHISLVEPNRADRRRAIDFVRGCIDLCLDLGTDVAHGLTGVVPIGVSNSEAWAWTLEAVAEISDYAATQGVNFGMEPVAGMLMSGAAELDNLLQQLPGRTVGVNYDPSHLIVKGDDPTEVALRFGSRIVAVHIKDAKVVPGGYEFPPLGVGTVDFDSLAAALLSVGYRGPLVVEYEAHAYGGYSLTEEEILGQSLAFVQRHFAEKS